MFVKSIVLCLNIQLTSHSTYTPPHLLSNRSFNTGFPVYPVLLGFLYTSLWHPYSGILHVEKEIYCTITYAKN